MDILYLAAFVGVAYLTRAKALRIVGALCGGTTKVLVVLIFIAAGLTALLIPLIARPPTKNNKPAITNSI